VLVELVGLGVTRTKIKWYIIPTYPALVVSHNVFD